MKRSVPTYVNTGGEDQAVLVIDALELRRAGVVGLLKPWAESNGLRIIAITPGGDADELEGQSLKMIVLVLGALSVGEPDPQRWVASLTRACPEAPLVLVSDIAAPGEVVAAFEAGARGFIPMSIAPPLAIQAFTFIMGGGSFFPPTALIYAMHSTLTSESANAIRHKVISTSSVQAGVLTSRQQEVLERLSEGASNKMIGRQLNLRESTVKVHIRQIMRKLGAKNRTQAALNAAHLRSPAIDQKDSEGADQSEDDGALPASRPVPRAFQSTRIRLKRVTLGS